MLVDVAVIKELAGSAAILQGMVCGVQTLDSALGPKVCQENKNLNC